MLCRSTRGSMEATPIERAPALREARQCPACRQRFSRDATFCPFDGVKLEVAPFNPLVDPLVGTRVDGRYDVVSLLGEGGMGRIYEVRHAALDRAFAMKVLRIELALDADLASRFILEAKAAASVKHPNVVQITDFGQMPDGVPFFVMELLVGHTLGEVIKAAGPIPPGRAVRIVRKVAGALAAAHAAGVVHRDLKPDNVFLVGGSRDVRAPGDPDRARSLAVLSYGADVRVVDFGAAKVVGSSRVTRQGVVFGTPHYMSPEQASGQPVDARADIYSLGVILYEMLTGRVPFEADTYMGVLTQHIFVQPVPPSRVLPQGGELGPLEAIALRCLAKKADERFASMDDVTAALDAAVDLRGDDDRSSPRPPPPSGSGASLPPIPPDSVLPSLAELRAPTLSEDFPARRFPWVAVLLVGASLVIAILVTVWRTTGHEVTGPEPPIGKGSEPLAPSAAAALPTAATPPASPASSPSASRTDVATPPPSAGVGEGTPASSASPSRRPARAKSPAGSQGGQVGDVDDVGDPFAKH
jgi:serine/threonine-protein kinase